MRKFKYDSLPIPLKTEKVEFPVINKAYSAYLGILQSPYCELIAIEKITSNVPEFNPLFEEGDELIVFDTEVEIPQHVKNDIKPIERIGIIFHKRDKYIPWVYAIRKDFPELPHTNMFL